MRPLLIWLKPCLCEYPFPALRYLVAVADGGCTQKLCQFLDGRGYGLPGLGGDCGSRFSVNRIDEQLLARAIKRRIGPTNELITRQDGHDVVPEPAFVFGSVDLAMIAKVGEAGGSLAITDQIVKRRERRCPGFPFLLLQPFKHREQLCI